MNGKLLTNIIISGATGIAAGWATKTVLSTTVDLTIYNSDSYYNMSDKDRILFDIAREIVTGLAVFASANYAAIVSLNILNLLNKPN